MGTKPQKHAFPQTSSWRYLSKISLIKPLCTISELLNFILMEFLNYTVLIVENLHQNILRGVLDQTSSVTHSRPSRFVGDPDFLNCKIVKWCYLEYPKYLTLCIPNPKYLCQAFPSPVITRIIQEDVLSSSIEPPGSFTAPVPHPFPAFDSLLLVLQSETKASDPIWVALGGVNHL